MGANHRSRDQCNSKWLGMSHYVQRYHRIFVDMRNEEGNEETEAQIIERAAIMFTQETENAWRYTHVWNIVKSDPRWTNMHGF